MNGAHHLCAGLDAANSLSAAVWAFPVGTHYNRQALTMDVKMFPLETNLKMTDKTSLKRLMSTAINKADSSMENDLLAGGDHSDSDCEMLSEDEEVLLAPTDTSSSTSKYVSAAESLSCGFVTPANSNHTSRMSADSKNSPAADNAYLESGDYEHANTVSLDNSELVNSVSLGNSELVNSVSLGNSEHVNNRSLPSESYGSHPCTDNSKLLNGFNFNNSCADYDTPPKCNGLQSPPSTTILNCSDQDAGDDIATGGHSHPQPNATLEQGVYTPIACDPSNNVVPENTDVTSSDTLVYQVPVSNNGADDEMVGLISAEPVPALDSETMDTTFAPNIVNTHCNGGDFSNVDDAIIIDSSNNSEIQTPQHISLNTTTDSIIMENDENKQWHAIIAQSETALLDQSEDGSQLKGNSNSSEDKQCTSSHSEILNRSYEIEEHNSVSETLQTNDTQCITIGELNEEDRVAGELVTHGHGSDNHSASADQSDNTQSTTHAHCSDLSMKADSACKASPDISTDDVTNCSTTSGLFLSADSIQEQGCTHPAQTSHSENLPSTNVNDDCTIVTSEGATCGSKNTLPVDVLSETDVPLVDSNERAEPTDTLSEGANPSSSIHEVSLLKNDLNEEPVPQNNKNYASAPKTDPNEDAVPIDGRSEDAVPIDVDPNEDAIRIADPNEDAVRLNVDPNEDAISIGDSNEDAVRIDVDPNENAVPSDAPKKDAVPSNASNKDAVRIGDPSKDAVRIDVDPNEDAVRIGDPSEDAVPSDAPKKDAVPSDASNEDAVSIDDPSKDAVRIDVDLNEDAVPSDPHSKDAVLPTAEIGQMTAKTAITETNEQTAASLINRSTEHDPTIAHPICSSSNNVTMAEQPASSSADTVPMAEQPASSSADTVPMTTQPSNTSTENYIDTMQFASSSADVCGTKRSAPSPCNDVVQPKKSRLDGVVGGLMNRLGKTSIDEVSSDSEADQSQDEEAEPEQEDIPNCSYKVLKGKMMQIVEAFIEKDKKLLNKRMTDMSISLHKLRSDNDRVTSQVDNLTTDLQTKEAKALLKQQKQEQKQQSVEAQNSPSTSASSGQTTVAVKKPVLNGQQRSHSSCATSSTTMSTPSPLKQKQGTSRTVKEALDASRDDQSAVVDLTEDDERPASTTHSHVLANNTQSGSIPSRNSDVIPPSLTNGSRASSCAPSNSSANGTQSKPTKTTARKRTAPRKRPLSQQPALSPRSRSRSSSPDLEITTVHTPVLATRHPAPLPPTPTSQATAPHMRGLPDRPTLRISRVQKGIVLSWNMTVSSDSEEIATYQLYAYQETSAAPSASLWKKVGDVKALALPMACTLTQFQPGNKYHFAVRATDRHKRFGSFSEPGSINLGD